MLYSLVQLLQVGVSIAQSTLSGGANHSVVLRRELLKILHGFLPFSTLGVAESCIESGKIASLGAAVVASELQESGETLAVALQGYVVVAGCKESLTIGQNSACLCFARNRNVVLVEADACDENDDGENRIDNGLLLFHEEGVMFVQSLLSCRLLTLPCSFFVVCHYKYFDR